MSARHRFPGQESGDSVITFVNVEEDEDKYQKKKPAWSFKPAQLTASIKALAGSPAVPEAVKEPPKEETPPDPLDFDWLRGEEEELIVMTARDRTLEFSNAIRSMQGRNIARAVNIRDPRKAKQMQSYSEFMMVAKQIGKNIASTYTKLEKLTLLAKRKSLFDDRPVEIQELTYIIKGDLNSLNQQIAKLQDIGRSQRRSSSGKHLLSHSSNMVVALQAKLVNMSNDFKQILEVRTENLKHQKTRRDQFSQGPVTNSLPPSSMRGSTQGSLLLSEQDDDSVSFRFLVKKTLKH